MKINKVKEVKDYLIVLVKNMGTGDVTKQPPNNIYAISKEGKIIWNIHDIVDKTIYFTGFNVKSDKDGNTVFIATDVGGLSYYIDLNNMVVLNVQGYRF